jgi:CHAT domain-containing protein
VDGGASAGKAEARSVVLRGLGVLRRLPQSRVEVESLSGLFEESEKTVLLDSDASVANLKKALSNVDGRLACFHLACHGHVDTKCPRLTGLFLSGNELLSLADVYRLTVPADLAVLSACRTNRGVVYRAEGVIGLVRGFFYAGCPRVVVSNWWVQDESNRAFMVSFYRYMLKEGLPASAALRATKLEMLRDRKDWSDPHHWAPFVLWGLRD